METIIKTVGIDFGDGNKVTRIQTTPADQLGEHEYKVVVERDGEIYVEYECEQDFFRYSEEYRFQCEAMREWLESKPKQKELEL